MPAGTLRQMHRVGFLGKYIPEFNALDCLVQHEFFHRFTADEHTLRCIETLDSLTEEPDSKYAVYKKLFHELEDASAYSSALLLHDTGRAENVRFHSDASTDLALARCPPSSIDGSATQVPALPGGQPSHSLEDGHLEES